MNLSKEQLHENLMRIIFFMKSKEFDKGDLHHLILRANSTKILMKSQYV